MISRKQHNDLIEQLLKQITVKEKQVQELKKQMKKAPQQIPHLQKSENEVILNKKINQLNKQYKDKINGLSQQLRSKSNEVKDLKQRLNLQKNIEAKQQSHLSQLYKKNFDRKASTPHDLKVAALISHYEDEINKKNNIIKTLKSKIQENPKQQQQNCTLKVQNSDKQQINKGISIVMHQAQINKLQNQICKYKRMYQEKNKEFKDMFRKYQQLTKQYYRILNEYNCQPNNLNKNKKKPINNVLFQALKQQQQKQPQQSQLSHHYFATTINKINKNNSMLKQDNDCKGQAVIQKIKQILKIEAQQEIIEYLMKMQSKVNNINKYDDIVKVAQQLIYKIGMGKVGLSETAQKLRFGMDRLQLLMQCSDLLDDICIEIGAKKNKIIEKIKDLKGIQQQYFKNMKNIKFVRELPKANKVIQFVEYFSLSDEQIELPQQLKQIYEQLKYLNKFMKQSDTILDRKSTSIQDNLQSVLRILQQYTNSDTYALIKHNNAKTTKNAIKN